MVLPNVKMAAPYDFAVSILIIHEDTNYNIYSNCLPTMSNTAQLFASTAEHVNMAQLFAIIAQLLAIIAKH